MPRKGSGCLKMARGDSMIDTTRMGHRILYLTLYIRRRLKSLFFTRLPKDS